MNDERRVYVSEPEAQRLWRRAAEIQVKESHKVEERSRDLRGPPGLAGLAHGQHVPLDDVLHAAREVGIDEVHLEAAVAELLEDRAAGVAPAPDAIERMAARFFGSPPPVLEAATVVGATPEEVYRVLQTLLPSEPYGLRLRDVMGDDPVRGGVLVFDAPGRGLGPMAYARNTLMAGDRVERLYVTLRAQDRHGSTVCRIAVRGRIQSDPEPAFWIGSVVTGLGATAGGVVGGVIGAGLGLAAPWVVLPAALLAALGGGVTYSSVRARYLAPLARGADGLQELLEVLTAAVKTGGGFLQRPVAGEDRAPGAEGQRRPVG
jgi:hypothetical protein